MYFLCSTSTVSKTFPSEVDVYVTVTLTRVIVRILWIPTSWCVTVSNNTCGNQCEFCCPGFVQKKWQPARGGSNKIFFCERKNVVIDFYPVKYEFSSGISFSSSLNRESNFRIDMVHNLALYQGIQIYNSIHIYALPVLPVLSSQLMYTVLWCGAELDTIFVALGKQSTT